MEKIEYAGFRNCYRLSNGEVEVVVTTEIGPRILRYAFRDGENLLGENLEGVIHTAFGDWKPWGGHRIWVAPEANPRSYWPDNTPINFEIVNDNKIRLLPPTETATGIEKEMVVTLAETGTGVTVEHRVTNRNLWEIELAPWAITIMRGGGTAILPQEPFLSWDEYLLPARSMALWHYTDLSDPRFALGPRFVRISTDEKADTPQKIGILNKQGWAGYAFNHTLFIKRFPFSDAAAYPDYNSNNEVYTRRNDIELESLAPLERVQPDESAVHVEFWELQKGVELVTDDRELAARLEPIIQKTE
jgi:hypothetical protein